MNCTNHTDPVGVIRVQAALIAVRMNQTIEPIQELTMSETITYCDIRGDALPGRLGNRMSVEEVARRLEIGRLAVYAMLDQGILPGIRLGRRWIITRHAYQKVFCSFIDHDWSSPDLRKGYGSTAILRIIRAAASVHSPVPKDGVRQNPWLDSV